jgi:hypothetical protein
MTTKPNRWDQFPDKHPVLTAFIIVAGLVIWVLALNIVCQFEERERAEVRIREMVTR